jgi:PPOX class probable F420-dependent enzyme
MELSSALDFARTHSHSVLVTIKRDGRPQLSNVAHHTYEDGLIRISITADRAKYHNLKREPWAALHITREDFYAYVVLEGDVELSPVATEGDDATLEELVSYYRDIRGEHDDWDAYRASMVADRRAMVRFRPTRAYGMA